MSQVIWPLSYFLQQVTTSSWQSTHTGSTPNNLELNHKQMANLLNISLFAVDNDFCTLNHSLYLIPAQEGHFIQDFHHDSKLYSIVSSVVGKCSSLCRHIPQATPHSSRTHIPWLPPSSQVPILCPYAYNSFLKSVLVLLCTSVYVSSHEQACVYLQVGTRRQHTLSLGMLSTSFETGPLTGLDLIN